ncbi:MAG: DoxX family membrane protein [Candidatus Omnitrophica bacterium]|nr:DoxX family membrane protein [Candidatus Omnitrophota bacterium]MBD3268849.1 DoxX family membrane protein [Candidatus Omnitrophota bacterium]
MKEVKVIDWALLILRVFLGIVFLAHGLHKIFGGGISQGFTSMLGSLNFNPPLLWAWIASIIETLGGAFLILGILPRLSALGIALVMLVAIWKVHGSDGFFAMNGGFEYPFLILGVCVSLILTGSGKISIFNKL